MRAAPVFFLAAGLFAFASGLFTFASGLFAFASERAVSEYKAEATKTILDLQQFRRTSSIPVRSAAGREGVATLVNLNPAINVWYLLSVAWRDGGGVEPAWHLENPNPHGAQVVLDEKYPAGIEIAQGNNRYSCDLLGGSPIAVTNGQVTLDFRRLAARVIALSTVPLTASEIAPLVK